jgi:hypothetical protein
MDLTVDRDFLRMLVVQVRALMAKTAEDPDDGSNPTDDPTPELQDDQGDLSRQEVMAEIGALDQRQQAELVALMWLGARTLRPRIGMSLSNKLSTDGKSQPLCISWITRCSLTTGLPEWSGLALAVLIIGRGGRSHQDSASAIESE